MRMLSFVVQAVTLAVLFWTLYMQNQNRRVLRELGQAQTEFYKAMDARVRRIEFRVGMFPRS